MRETISKISAGTCLFSSNLVGELTPAIAQLNWMSREMAIAFKLVCRYVFIGFECTFFGYTSTLLSGCFMRRCYYDISMRVKA